MPAGYLDVDLPPVGARARLRVPVERFPHFQVEAGAEGTLTEATDSLVALRMEETIPGAEEWDNEICWTADDAASAGDGRDPSPRSFPRPQNSLEEEGVEP
jgi:hypothetical protein